MNSSLTRSRFLSPIRLLTVGLVAIALCSCGRPDISREQWERMSAQKKIVVVRSLQGHEEALLRKGGRGALASAGSPEDYARLIDERYRQGDTRPVSEIWRSLVE